MTYFAFHAELRDVPAGPTHCLGCGAELAPLRRYAGLCAQCVRQRPQPKVARVPAEPKYEVIAEYVRENPSGRRERYVEVRCSCGRRRTMKQDTWNNHHPSCCNKCRLRAVDARGFEPEFAR